MTVALVHGVPETAAIWTPLIGELEAQGITDIVTLSPPGFGAPTPPGWPATRAAYHDWLVAALDDLGGDIDLVGHDWGAGHVYGVLAERPDLVRSWVADCAGLLDPDYQWHDAATAWQTPELGEGMIAAMIGDDPEHRVALFAGLGITSPTAEDLARGLDAEMGRCILALYRSAVQPEMARLGTRLADRPLPHGLVVIATADTYAGTPDTAATVAASLGAATVRLDGLGHWWMLEDPAGAAAALVAHWRTDRHDSA